MITIDRDAGTSVQEQLAGQLRYLIASGHYKVEETLPSTRTLARQLGLSFHTVRKAYQQLEQDGLLEARVGSGYRVKARQVLGKSERYERGAAIVEEALQRLIGLGLHEAELEHLIDEQLGRLTGPVQTAKLVFAAPFREMAELCAAQIQEAVQQPIEPATLAQLERHADADVVVARFVDLRRVLDALPRADAVGVVTYLSPPALARLARMLPHQTLGLVTRYADAIPPLLAELRRLTAFAGPTLATSIDDRTAPLDQVIDQSDLLLYTPPCRRRLRARLDAGGPRHEMLAPVVSPDALDDLRSHLPRT